MSLKTISSVPVALAAILALSACSAPYTPPRTSNGSVTAPVKAASVPAAQPTDTYVAGAFQPYTKSAYARALADGKTVLLDFHANWCEICVANSPVIEQAFQKLNNPQVVGFKANYDTETALETQFGVRSQATLILVKGSKEAKRVMGPQTVETVMALLKS